MPLPPDGPEERTAAAQEQSWLNDDRLTADEQFADESRDDTRFWMRNDGVDAMNWPRPITVQPANTDRLEVQAAKMIKRMQERL